MSLMTRVDEVQDKLHVALLANRGTLEAGECTLGWPPGGRHARQIWIDEEARIETRYATATAASRVETIELDVKCTYQITGTDYKKARAGLLELVAVVEAAVSADPTLAGVAHLVKVARIRIDASFADERTRFAAATVTVSADVDVPART